MSNISIQFHALPEELATFVRESVEDFDLFVVGLYFFPFSVIDLRRADLEKVIVKERTIKEVVLSVGAPCLTSYSGIDFSEKNPDSSYLDIGRISEKGMEQSCFSVSTDDNSALKIWKELARRLRRMTKAGVIAVNVETGAAVPVRSFRYTEGAKIAEVGGTRILGPAGIPNLRLGTS